MTSIEFCDGNEKERYFYQEQKDISSRYRMSLQGTLSDTRYHALCVYIVTVSAYVEQGPEMGTPTSIVPSNLLFL